MLFLINMPIAIATVLYSCYAYLSLDQNTLGIWHLFFYPSLTLILQTCVCYSSLSIVFPCVLYDITDYQRPAAVTISIYVLLGVLTLMVGKILFLSVLYIGATDDSAMMVIYQIICFLALFSTVVSYFSDSMQYCSGWAYSDYLKHHNHPDVEYAYLPFTLPCKEMSVYLEERYIARRAHLV